LSARRSTSNWFPSSALARVTCPPPLPRSSAPPGSNRPKDAGLSGRLPSYTIITGPRFSRRGEMQLRSLTICAIVFFTAGLAVASFAGFREFIPGLLQGALITIQITIGGCILAVIMALVAAIAKMYGPWPLRWLAIAYIEVFRGTSALVQLFWLF